MVSNLLHYALPIMFLLMVLEIWISHTCKLNLYSFTDLFSNLGTGLLSQVFVPFTRIARVGGYIWIYQHVAFWHWSTNVVTTWAAGLLLYDFMYYWQHRMMHSFRLLWAVHAVHHQSDHFNMSISLRQPVLGGLIAGIFYLPMALIGVPPIVFAVVSTIDLLYQYCLHTQCIGRLGALDRILVTPSNHRVHHGVNAKYINKNFGGILVLWDRCFGTFAGEDSKIPSRFGTHEPLMSHNPIWANLHGFAMLFRFKPIKNTLQSQVMMDTGFVEKETTFAGNRLYSFKNVRNQIYFYMSIQFVVLVLLIEEGLFHNTKHNLNLYILIIVWTVITLNSLTNLLDHRVDGFRLEFIRIFFLAISCGAMISTHIWVTAAIIILLISSISIAWLSKKMKFFVQLGQYD